MSSCQPVQLALPFEDQRYQASESPCTKCDTADARMSYHLQTRH